MTALPAHMTSGTWPEGRPRGAVCCTQMRAVDTQPICTRGCAHPSRAQAAVEGPSNAREERGSCRMELRLAPWWCWARVLVGYVLHTAEPWLHQAGRSGWHIWCGGGFAERVAWCVYTPGVVRSCGVDAFQTAQCAPAALVCPPVQRNGRTAWRFTTAEQGLRSGVAQPNQHVCPGTFHRCHSRRDAVARRAVRPQQVGSIRP